MGNINLPITSPISDYIHIIESNAFSSIINKPTRVMPTSLTIIDRVLTNNIISKLTPNVLVRQISD